MNFDINPHISVDIVVFGFDQNEGIKVLLIERDKITERSSNKNIKYKLPGGLIGKNEFLNDSAKRILEEFTGLKNIYLKQFGVFDNPTRLKNGDDLEWLKQTTKLSIDRVITVAYYSLINLEQYSGTELSKSYNANWYAINKIPPLIFDHNEIIEKGLNTLRKEFLLEPLCFELLPKKFTINQLQRLTETILQTTFDNRNFRKKIMHLHYIEPLNDWQKDVNHKPARFYIFNKEKFQKQKEEVLSFII